MKIEMKEQPILGGHANFQLDRSVHVRANDQSPFAKLELALAKCLIMWVRLSHSPNHNFSWFCLQP